MVKLPKVSFSLHLFLFFFLLIATGLSLQLKVLLEELKPAHRQATEESMVDAANLLAEIARPEFVGGNISNGSFDSAFQAFKERELQAQIWSKTKVESLLKVYITDAKGIVVYHSEGVDIGKNYYSWNDVYKTLKGQYGARSTEAIQGDPLSTEMYVAAPIKVDDQIIGVLTLIKPSLSIEPFLENSQNKVRNFSIVLILLAMFLGLFASYWLTRSIRKLNLYATKVSQGEDIVALPEFMDSELNDLAKAMDTMKLKLEGKDYVENYIHSLTHEMKSPVAAIKGASEILEGSLSEKDRAHFLNNIQTESARLELIIIQLLDLATLENRKDLEKLEIVDLVSLITEIKQSLQMFFDKKLIFKLTGTASIEAERFLLRQAIENILINAIEFSPKTVEIRITISKYQENSNSHNKVIIQIEDKGTGIPEYAIEKVFDRFYSLPRPDSRKKNSGLGLSFVKQICHLHQGDCRIFNTNSLNNLPNSLENTTLVNAESGTIVQLIFPIKQIK